MSSAINIHDINGYCPVQAWGTVDDVPFYFRARGNRWTLSIGTGPVVKPDWSYQEAYGETQFAAGWMEIDEARAFITKAVALYDSEKSAAVK